MKSQRLKALSLVSLLLIVIGICGSLSVACSSGCGTKTYTLTYTAGMGYISGPSTQTINCSANGTAVTAVAESCYHFVNWSDGVTTASRTDTNVRGNIVVIANFAPNGLYALIYNAGLGGSISGSSNQSVACGASGSAVTAIANTNYLFVNWSDGRMDNPRMDGWVTSNITVIANFVDPTLMVNDMKSRISRIVIGHNDGSIVRLFPGSPHFDEIAQEAILVALGINTQCNCIFDFQTPEELAKLNKNFVYVFFKSPTDFFAIGGWGEITTNELIFWPEGSPPSVQQEIWASCHGSYCQGFDSSRSMEALDNMIDNLND